MLFDGHNDTLKRAFLHGTSFFKRNTVTGLDLPRAQSVGYCGGLFAIMTPPETEEERDPSYGLTVSESGWEVAYPRPISPTYAEGFTNEVLDGFLAEAATCGAVEVARDAEQLRRCIADGAR